MGVRQGLASSTMMDREEAELMKSPFYALRDFVNEMVPFYIGDRNTAIALFYIGGPPYCNSAISTLWTTILQ